MNLSRTDELMHLVLDGEATPAEAQELARRLSTDASARARFDELRYVFDGLSQVQQAFPPEGLIASVLANIPQKRPHFGPRDQLFAAPGVIEASSRKARGKGLGRSEWMDQILQPWAFSRGKEMNEQKRGLANNRKIGSAEALPSQQPSLRYLPGCSPRTRPIRPGRSFRRRGTMVRKPRK